jgi:hypothetical protein
MRGAERRRLTVKAVQDDTLDPTVVAANDFTPPGDK